MHRTNIGANQVPPGALVSFLQRGIQYVEMQSNLNEVRPLHALVQSLHRSSEESSLSCFDL